MPFNIAVVGTIAAGKSTLCMVLSERLGNAIHIIEPVDKWINSGMLQGLYSAFAARAKNEIDDVELAHYQWHFQFGAILTRISMENYAHTLANRNDSKFLIFDSHRRFDSAFTEDIVGIDGQNIANWYNSACRELDNSMPESVPDVIVHMATPTATCFRNISKRGRDCEKSIDIAYLERLHIRIGNICNSYRNSGTPIVVINPNGNMDEEACVEQVIKEISPLVMQKNSDFNIFFEDSNL